MIGYSEFTDQQLRNSLALTEDAVRFHERSSDPDAARTAAVHRSGAMQLRDEMDRRGMLARVIMADARPSVIVQQFEGPVPQFAHVVVCILDGAVTNEHVAADLDEARENLAEYADDSQDNGFLYQAQTAVAGQEVRFDARCRFVVALRRLDELATEDLAYLVQRSGGPFLGALAPFAAA